MREASVKNGFNSKGLDRSHSFNVKCPENFNLQVLLQEKKLVQPHTHTHKRTCIKW